MLSVDYVNSRIINLCQRNQQRKNRILLQRQSMPIITGNVCSQNTQNPSSNRFCGGCGKPKQSALFHHENQSTKSVIYQNQYRYDQEMNIQYNPNNNPNIAAVHQNNQQQNVQIA